MSREGKMRRAHQLANKWVGTRIDDFYNEVDKLIDMKELSREENDKMKKILAKNLALAYAVGWMNGAERKVLYTPSGGEL